MSAEIVTKVQAKTYFSSSMMDLNNGLCNFTWDLYHDDRNRGYNSFLMSQTMDGYLGYPKEQMRQTILKQDSIFRHQLQELHRLYKRQRDLMNEFAMNGHYKEMNSQRRVIDLELPADPEEDMRSQPMKNCQNLSTKRAYNLADLNEPFQMEEPSLVNKKQDLPTNSKFWYLQTVPKIFGVDFSQSSSWSQRTSVDQNHWTQPGEKHEVLYGKKNLEKQLPHWLMKTKGKETLLYQMNLDSLQQHSQQFFKKPEKLQTGSHITKILGVPVSNVQDSSTRTEQTNAENDKNDSGLEPRHVIDLNLSIDEEDELLPTPDITETVAGVALMEIDLEAPAVVEAETDDQEFVKSAAEAIVSISSSDPLPADETLLHWFAEVVASGECDKKSSVNENEDDVSIPEGMDYFEYMTLKVQETEVAYCCYETVAAAAEEEDGGKRVVRKGQGRRGRQRKDFQRDVLPGIVSLSRREVTEDLQTFEVAFNGIGVSWQWKRKAGRGRRRLVAVSPRMPSPPPPPQVAVERSACVEAALNEKSLSGWGKRTRRLPRQRCQNGGSHQSFALKC